MLELILGDRNARKVQNSILAPFVPFCGFWFRCPYLGSLVIVRFQGFAAVYEIE